MAPGWWGGCWLAAPKSGCGPEVIRTTTELSAPGRDAFDAILDARSPAEYAQDHLPGAISLPVLSDAERAEVGTLYVQVSRFEARRRGAAMVARNIAGHLETALAGRPAGFRPLVYCWRGGMRSNALATVLAQVGWPAVVLDGGYRRWRRHVVGELHAPRKIAHALRLLDGPTGAGKTAVLQSLGRRGAQVLDLEQLAGHRGSLFGATGQRQPGQKLFESRLFDALARMDPARPVYAEAEIEPHRRPVSASGVVGRHVRGAAHSAGGAAGGAGGPYPGALPRDRL